MHVLILNYEFPPAGGGAGFASANIGRELVTLGVDVDILTSVIDGEADGELLHGMRVYRVPSWRKGMHDCGLLGAYSYAVFAAWKRRRLLASTHYDLEHYFFSLPTGAISLTSFGENAPPYVVSLRGSDVPGYDPFNERLERLHKLTLPLTRRIWRRASSVVALSNALRETALLTSPDIDFDVIPNGMDISKFSPRCSPSAAAERPLRIITVARLLERKGIQHLLEAIAKPVPLEVTLKIVGTGSYEDSLRRQVVELGLADRVEFAGFVHSDELPTHYQEADVFVLPSQIESFGLVFAEAMASGLAVIATRIGGIPELIRSGTEGILVSPASPGEIRAALEYVMEHPESLQKMGVAGRRRIEEKYTWRAVAKRYLAVYQDVLQRGARHS
jgi:glycosyltransferase involved in cell wall biosynthesis